MPEKNDGWLLDDSSLEKDLNKSDAVKRSISKTKENVEELPKHSAFEDKPVSGIAYDPKDYEIKMLPNGLCQIIRKKDGKVMD